MASNIKILNPKLGQTGLDAYNILIDTPVGVNDDAASCGAATNLLDIIDIVRGLVGVGQIDPNIDYNSYKPLVGTITFTYTGENVTKVTIDNTAGIKVIDFSYDGSDEVWKVNIDNYGISSREIIFNKDVEGNITTIGITDN